MFRGPYIVTGFLFKIKKLRLIFLEIKSTVKYISPVPTLSRKPVQGEKGKIHYLEELLGARAVDFQPEAIFFLKE
jgi:hypothetical protein